MSDNGFEFSGDFRIAHGEVYHRAWARMRDEKSRRVRLSRPMQKCFRFELPFGDDWEKRFIRVAGEDVLRRMLDIDDKLEVHYQPLLEKWVMFRNCGGGQRDTAMLAYQFTLEQQPGNWLIRDLNMMDKWRNYDSVDAATRGQIAELEERGLKAAEEAEKVAHNERVELAKDAYNAVKGKATMVI